MNDSRRQPGHNSYSSFRLPSFSTISTNVNPSGSLQQARCGSIHEAQVDNGMMRQQLAARDHIIAIHKKEQEQLQASLLRSQSRYEAWKTNVCEEKTRLKQEVATLATQVAQLTREREQTQNQARADCAQWQQIMSMSSKLQMQSVEESRRFSADREQWARDRERLVQRISELEGSSVESIDLDQHSDMTQDLRRS